MLHPVQQKCLSNNILYQANITPIDKNSETKVYFGICKTTFKLRYANHQKIVQPQKPQVIYWVI